MLFKRSLVLILLLSVMFGNAQQLTKNAPPVKQLFKFLNWYGGMQNKLSMIPLVQSWDDAIDDEGKVIDSTKFYRVNFAATKQYIGELKKSGFFSNKYLLERQNYFLAAEKEFRKNHVYDGPPEGFDADLVMLSQDYSLEELDKADANILKKVGNKCIVEIAFAYNDLKLLYSLSNNNGKWQIDGIENTGL